MKVCVLVGSCVILASGNTLQGSRRVKNEARAKQFSGPKKINPDRPHPACSNVSETKFVDFNHERILCVVPTAKSPLLKQVKEERPPHLPHLKVGCKECIYFVQVKTLNYDHEYPPFSEVVSFIVSKI